ncbi:hypothetical protein DK66_3078 [Brucella suis 1330]|nr:hypothetical protein DK66_3078 [Brucella suis 1330]
MLGIGEDIAIEKLAALHSGNCQIGDECGVGIDRIGYHAVKQSPVVMSNRHHKIRIFRQCGKHTASRRLLVGLNPIDVQKSAGYPVSLTALERFLNRHGLLMFLHIFFHHSFKKLGFGGEGIEQSTFGKARTSSNSIE